MRGWLDRFMAGRNGVDFLNKKLLIPAVVLCALGVVLRVRLFRSLAASILLVILFRCFSRNLPQRQREDLAARAFYDKKMADLAGSKTRFRQRKDYRFYSCPGCGNRLRVPRGKGRIQITCPRCGQRFERKS